MEQFDIIGALESYALGRDWAFYYTPNDFYGNIEMTRQWDPDQLVLIAEFESNPIIQNGKIPEITYNGLLALGRKSESTGTNSNLDETPKQKYDRRLKVLAQTLAGGMGEFACNENLNITSFPLIIEINKFDANLDFATSLNATFVQ